MTGVKSVKLSFSGALPSVLLQYSKNCLKVSLYDIIVFAEKPRSPGRYTLKYLDTMYAKDCSVFIVCRLRYNISTNCIGLGEQLRKNICC
jgi:hypothetical protein